MSGVLIKQKYLLLKNIFNERTERLFAAAEAHSLGSGGIAIVSRATGIERHRIARGIKELLSKKNIPVDSIRKVGAGRKKTILIDKTLESDLDKLIEPTTRGDPESPLKWTTISLRNLSKELNKKHKTSHRMIAEILHAKKYSLQANKKTTEGKSHPNRDEQFHNINKKVIAQQKIAGPAISVDAKKKELVGNFKNSGREWYPKGEPEEVKSHDFMIKELGKVCPYGVYDIVKNEGWVNVGIDHDTASFAVESIRQWWNTMGKKEYENAEMIFITADAGGSNGVRNRLWKWELQKLANEINKPISISHFPPGTSKWNKIEHRLFSFISKNWRAKPLTCHEVIVNLISSTTTDKGLKVKCRLDKEKYSTKIKIPDLEFNKINLKRDSFLGDWNYTIFPWSLS